MLRRPAAVPAGQRVICFGNPGTGSDLLVGKILQMAWGERIAGAREETATRRTGGEGRIGGTERPWYGEQRHVVVAVGNRTLFH